MELRIWPLVSIVLLTLSCCVFPARAQTDASNPLAAVPACGLICLGGSLNVSSCAQFSYNQTCLCADQVYNDAVTACVLSSCTVKESLVTKNATEASCGIAPRDRSHVLYLVVVILGVITNCVVVARLVFRVAVNKTGLYPDDWAILVTLFVGISGTIFISVGSVPNGVGKDLWTLTPNQITNFGMWFFASEVQYFVSISTLKLSLLLFYLRIFPSMTIKRLLWATMVFDILYGVAFLLAALLQCRPISFFWTNWDGEHQGYCANVNAVGWANAAISIVLDLWMLAVPLSQLRRLRLHWKKKVGVALMFFVGTFVTVVSIVRLQSLVSFANSANLTYDNWDVNFWSTLEVNTGIICACMPTIRQILAWYFPKVFGSGTRPGRYYPERGDRGVNSSYERAVQARNLELKRTESRAGLTTWGDTTICSPSPTLKSGHAATPSPLATSPYPLSPPPPPPPRSRSAGRSLSLEDIRGIRVERSFYVDQSSIEEGSMSVQLEDLKRHPHDMYNPANRF